MNDMPLPKALADSSVKQRFSVANVLRSLPLSAQLLTDKTRADIERICNQTGERFFSCLDLDLLGGCPSFPLSTT